MRTITVGCYSAEGVEYFNKKEARKLLSIRHHKTFNDHLCALEFNHTRLGWEEIKEILSLKLFLYARMGYHTRRMYRVLKAAGQLEKVFEYLNIDVEKEFEVRFVEC